MKLLMHEFPFPVEIRILILFAAINQELLFLDSRANYYKGTIEEDKENYKESFLDSIVLNREEKEELPPEEYVDPETVAQTRKFSVRHVPGKVPGVLFLYTPEEL